MNPRNLRRSLRTGGWSAHAKNLPSFLAREGLGASRTLGGRTLRFILSDDQTQLRAYLVDGQAWTLVADEAQVYLRLDEAPVSQGFGESEDVHIVFPVPLLLKINRMAEQQGKTRSALIRRACELYLQGQRRA